MATYKSDVLSFGYDASLHVRHPERRVVEVGSRLGIATRRSHGAGDSRKTPAGTPLPGVYSENYWWGDLPTEDQQDLTDFLRRLVTKLAPHREYLYEIAETGGNICIFIGVGSSRCCAHQFDRQLLTDLAATGLDLRIDFYGAELPQRRLHPEVNSTA